VTLTATTPNPFRLTTCGLLLALSVIFRVPEREPRAEGVKVTEIKQLAPARRVAGLIGQALVSTKSDKLLVMLVMVSGVLNPFLRVICLDPAVVLRT
ncbi:MAG: hypothetical protein WB562_16575, partial [Candidatus Sulfotelmatobacter sp.]